MALKRNGIKTQWRLIFAPNTFALHTPPTHTHMHAARLRHQTRCLVQSVHAISDIWINHYSGNVWATLELFLESPFDTEPVWSTVINTTQVGGVVTHPPPVRRVDPSYARTHTHARARALSLSRSQCVSLSMYVSLSVSLCLSVCLSVCLSLLLSNCMQIQCLLWAVATQTNTQTMTNKGMHWLGLESAMVWVGESAHRSTYPAYARGHRCNRGIFNSGSTA